MSFQNLLSTFGSSSALSFTLVGEGYEFEFVVRDLADQHTQVIESLRIAKDGTLIGSLRWAALRERLTTYFLETSAGVEEVEVTFSGILPQVSEASDPISVAAICSQILPKLVGNTYWLQANRATPPRHETYRPDAPLAPDGTGITQLIYANDISGSDIMSALADWYQTAMGSRLAIRRGAFASEELFSFCIESSGSLIELADTGEGMGQVLSIIALLLLAERDLLGPNPILVLEHPELHLHAAAEPALARLLCRVAASGKAQILAETHSESFLLAVQLAILDQQLKVSDVLVYWVEKEANQPAKTAPIRFDSEARPAGGSWPPGVFNERAEMARAVVLARRPDSNNAS
ncbi:AAA family ATPase [Sphingomonas sp. AP4-R1]|uniref:AAA family ATPase n=1 Tax=Sphingomonas sp. AP4-R1 TaxID=2735134 RepID=UPI001493D002|nr:AAA family ATPase [Sphingomonas sp. AP4-R1]QJU58372.1 AAA family ATPase [Sphingomonas sp. AP4-R1]